MTSHNETVNFTSLEQFREYYRAKEINPNSEGCTRYYQIGLKAAILASENSLKTLHMFKPKD